MKSFSLSRLLLVLLPAIFAVLLLLTIPSREVMSSLFIHSSYFLIAGMVLVWLFYLGNFLKKGSRGFREFFIQAWPGIVGALIIVVFVFVTVKPGCRVLSDETTLVGVSKSMDLDQTIYYTSMGLWFQDSYIPIQNDVPRRPLLYPFSVHLLHALFG